ITVTVNALQDEDVIANADRTREYVADFNARNETIELRVIEDGTVQVNDRLQSMTSSGVTGVFLVLLVLALFLNRYLAFWVALKIPIAIVASFLLRDIQGLTINVVSLFGFILVLGILVDDGVVIGENIYRWAKEKGAKPAKAALEGTMEMVTPILISISTTAVAFSLFFFLPTQAGEFFGEMGFVVIAVLFMAVIESFFFLPAHLAHSKALKEDTKLTKIEEWFNGSVDWIRDRIYRPTVERFVRYGWLNVLTLVFFVAALAGMFSLVGSGAVGFTFFPNLDDDAHFIQLEMPAGTPEEVTREKLVAIQEAAYRANAKLSEDQPEGDDYIQFVEVFTGPAANEGQLKVTYLSGEKRKLSSFAISNAIRAEAPPLPEAESIVYGLGAATAIFGKPVAFSLR
ncbi:MAG: efflux RND transporter permease subunit, partial [Bacteroidota bacterium]